MPLLVLYICTGNVCRSPAAEHLMRAWANPDTLLVASAGVSALEGRPVDPSTARALDEYGVDSTAHRASQFEAWMAERADLVLTAERSHRDRVMVEAPSAFRRTFTMREFARLADRGFGLEQADVVAKASRLRALRDPRAADYDDIPDPFGAHAAYARSVVGAIAESVRATVRALGAAPMPTRRPRPAAPPVPRATRPRPNRRPRPGKF